MKLDCVTVCVNYSDFLAETIKSNIAHFDHWIIVTTPDDTDTREVCRKWGLKCIVTNEVYRDGDEFNKGRAIIRGIDQLAADSWVLHLDADIVLPTRFRNYLDVAHLDENCIYGCDRIMIQSWADWQKFKQSGYLQHDYHCRVNFPVGYQLGERWASQEYGYCPIGFFQLWNAKCDLYKGMHSKLYPFRHGDAARGDVQHALQWDRQQRVLLPEIVCVHLNSEPAKLGTNWRGRQTVKFGPTKESQK